MVFKPQTFYGEMREEEIETDDSAQSQIETAVADLLAVTDGVDATDISVVGSKGMIFLRGSVAFAEEIERAVDIALSVKGVKEVTVDLVVTGPDVRNPDVVVD